MESTKNQLTPDQKKFFNELTNYLDTKLFYYGSVQRPDYFPGKSDIDVDIFCENESSTISKLQHFLHANKKNFKKVYWKMRKNKKLITGYKINYKNSFLKAEFAIYNEKYKQYILEEHNSKVILPFYATWFLNILKVLFYQLRILPNSYYIFFKKKILNYSLGIMADDEFVVL